MGMDEFWGWVGFLELRGETVEDRGRRVAGGLLQWAKVHNDFLGKKNG